VDSSYGEYPYSCSFIYLNDNLIDVQVFCDKLYKNRELSDTLQKTSATHSEIYGLYSTTKRVVYPYNLIHEFAEVETPIVIKTDCDPARFLLENRVNNKRTIHLAVKFRYVSELIENKFIKLVREKGSSMISDLGTKPQPRPVLEKWCSLIFDVVHHETSNFSFNLTKIVIHD
jgi:hypothetical protein